MEFTSILDLKESAYKEKGLPAFYQDLNLDQVIERIRLDWGDEVSSFYYYFPADSDCEDYRREVFSDMKTGNLYDILCGFTGMMKRRREACAWKGEVKETLQKSVWHLREVGCYCDAFGQLLEKIEKLPLKSRGMRAFREYLGRYLSGAFYVKMQSQAVGLLKDMEGFRLVLTYENDRIAISQGEVEGSYDDFLATLFPGHGKHLASPFTAEVNLVELEEGLMKAFRKRNPDFFRGVEEFCAEYENYADGCLIRFSSEIGFYLSFYRFERKMQGRGYAFCEPVMLACPMGKDEKTYRGNCNNDMDKIRRDEEFVGNEKISGTAGAGKAREAGARKDSEAAAGETAGARKDSEAAAREAAGARKDSEAAAREAAGVRKDSGAAAGETAGAGKDSAMQACGLYDLALACAGKDMVANDTILYPEEKFFILTGPNQGGKTTFARSLGQLVYFAKMGLDVPASSAKMYRFTDILTHFCVEESVETGRGKLREELERLANIMAASLEEGAFVFVVINELFTTAANYDACIMGKRVLDHFLAKGSRGIYVTHLSELAGEDPQLVSLRAMLDENGMRTFRIDRSRKDAPADAGSLVGKHGLTYGQLKERLA